LQSNALSAGAATVGRRNLIGLSAKELEAFFRELDEKPFRARQLLAWIYRRHAVDFDGMTDISLLLRQRLAQVATLALPNVVADRRSADGTRKWLVDIGGGQAVECVYIPEPNRATLCISSQAGCAMDCSFCATGQQGFNRNLDAAEILGQVLLAQRALGPDVALTNIVFMGMGEPLANYRNVIPVVNLLTDDCAFGLSRRRVTISTAGLVPQIRKLSEDCNVALAVSLHAANDRLRDELVPINRRHPIAELLEACWHYARCLASRQITFEYAMLRDVNDGIADARALARLLRDRPAKVNLIPFNPFPGTRYACSSADVMDAFCTELWNRGVVATIRRTRGEDIAAACGQLAGQIRDRTSSRLGSKHSRAGHS
jgi:23S rRNA (adenine2503-C2)-methyltransferase